MQLRKRQLVLISFMLFSLFFGAGNLIFPPFLGQNAGNHTVVAFLGFMITAVILPVLGVIVVAKFSGLENLGKLVGSRFALVFTLLIYLSIGPGLGIPRAASVPFEMAVAPYIPEGANIILFTIPDGTPDGTKVSLFMLIYSLVFFSIALWLCMTPGKLVRRIGTFLTPSLLTLIVVLFISFLVKGKTNVGDALGAYQDGAFLQGFEDGYQTMDAIAALNFGLVIATTLDSFGVTEKKGMLKYTIFAGVVAGSILTLVYFMLAYIGAESSGIYPPDGNGAVLLRLVVQQLFGTPGAILLAAIFTLACLTTCVGLINSISAYFAMLFKKVSYGKWAIIITVFSFLICNLGLNMILRISVPVLNIVYPIAIMLIFFGLTSKLWSRFRAVYPATIAGIAVVSVFSTIVSVVKNDFHVNLGAFGEFLSHVPLFDDGFFWVLIALVVLAITMIVYAVYYGTHRDKWALATATVNGGENAVSNGDTLEVESVDECGNEAYISDTITLSDATDDSTDIPVESVADEAVTTDMDSVDKPQDSTN